MFVRGDLGVVRFPSGRAVLIVVLTAALAVSACSTFGKKKKPTLADEERPVDLLYNAGSAGWIATSGASGRLLPRGGAPAPLLRVGATLDPKDGLRRLSPTTTPRRSPTPTSSSRSIRNPSTPYAYYLKAICYFEQIVDVGRDGPDLRGVRRCARSAKRYPYSEYAADARLKIDMVQDQLAGKEMTVGRFYLRSGDPMGAIGRLQDGDRQYQTTSHTPEALYRLVEAYLTVGLVGKAKKNGAVLGYNYPGDPWYQAAYALLTSRGYRPDVEPNAEGQPSYFPNPFGHHDKSTTLPPPGEAPAQATTVSDNTGAAATQPPPVQQSPAKKPTGFVHGFLGL